MGSLRARLVDLNRFSKRYPLIRAPKRMSFLGDQDLAIEVGTIAFNNTDTGTLVFEVPFKDTSYQLAVAARDTGDVGGVDVNLYVTNKLASSVTVKASAAFTGNVDVFVIKVGQ